MNWEEVEQHCCLVKPGGWVERSETGIEERSFPLIAVLMEDLLQHIQEFLDICRNIPNLTKT